MKVIRYLIVFAAILLVVLVVRLFGPVDSVPRIRASGSCDNGKLNVSIYQQRLRLLPLSRVGILVRIADPNEKVLFDKIVYEDGWWYQDIGDMYTNVQCGEDAVFVGPKFSPEDYYRIAKSDILPPT